jgi:hypothetical protein
MGNSMKPKLTFVSNRDQVSSVKNPMETIRHASSMSRRDRAISALSHLKAASYEMEMLGAEPSPVVKQAIRDLEKYLNG